MKPAISNVQLLRRQTKTAGERSIHVISAADPLNLGGIITPGAKTPVRPGNRILLVNGAPSARMLGDEMELLKGGGQVSSAEAERYLRVVRPIGGISEQL